MLMVCSWPSSAVAQEIFFLSVPEYILIEKNWHLISVFADVDADNRGEKKMHANLLQPGLPGPHLASITQVFVIFYFSFFLSEKNCRVRSNSTRPQHNCKQATRH